MSTARPVTPTWMPIAIGEMWTKRFPAGECNLRIVEYNGYTNLLGYDDKISWCSSFINWCLFQAGLVGTGSARSALVEELGHFYFQPRVRLPRCSSPR